MLMVPHHVPVISAVHGHAERMFSTAEPTESGRRQRLETAITMEILVKKVVVADSRVFGHATEISVYTKNFQS